MKDFQLPSETKDKVVPPSSSTGGSTVGNNAMKGITNTPEPEDNLEGVSPDAKEGAQRITATQATAMPNSAPLTTRGIRAMQGEASKD